LIFCRRWVPNCGPRLIVNSKPPVEPEVLHHTQDSEPLPNFVVPCRKLSIEDYPQNINIFTEFGDLTPNQILTLFDQFINWPEYKESSFNASLENTMMKMHTNPDDNVDLVELHEDEDVQEESKKPKDLNKEN